MLLALVSITHEQSTVRSLRRSVDIRLRGTFPFVTMDTETGNSVPGTVACNPAFMLSKSLGAVWIVHIKTRKCADNLVYMQGHTHSQRLLFERCFRYAWWESIVFLRKVAVAALVIYLHAMNNEGLQLLVSFRLSLVKCRSCKHHTSFCCGLVFAIAVNCLSYGCTIQRRGSMTMCVQKCSQATFCTVCPQWDIHASPVKIWLFEIASAALKRLGLKEGVPALGDLFRMISTGLAPRGGKQILGDYGFQSHFLILYFPWSAFSRVLAAS